MHVSPKLDSFCVFVYNEIRLLVVFYGVFLAGGGFLCRKHIKAG